MSSMSLGLRDSWRAECFWPVSLLKSEKRWEMACIFVDLGAERVGGGCVVVAEALEIRLEGWPRVAMLPTTSLRRSAAEPALSSRVRRASAAMRRLSLSGSSVRRGPARRARSLRSSR